MPTLVTTARGTGTLNTETRRTRDVSPLIAQLEGDAGPLVSLLMRLRSKAATDPKFEWFEDELLPRFDVPALLGLCRGVRVRDLNRGPLPWGPGEVTP